MKKNHLSDLKRLQSTHTVRVIRRRLNSKVEVSSLRDFIYGAIDGTITTFAIIAGAIGAQFSTTVIIILGFANLLGDGLSMAVSNYLGTQAESELLQKKRQEEEEHIQSIPEGEREEIRQIFAKKGFIGDDLEKVVATITARPKLWIETMLKEEHSLSLASRSAWKAGVVTFLAFVLVGFLPLCPFLFPVGLFDPIPWSLFLAGVCFFFIGGVKGPILKKSIWRCGFQTLFTGGAAALVAFLIGHFLKKVI